ncbi:hypothetical protein B0A50_06669 [Salinomyces thailandicus]|uniref:ribonuclease Z n=1 Tax=Salinomyces thailandicus TaxID=706561 RepID=A0A4U0TRL2_9PEZI|nr:hypothetical protein B0A50_06669 [Salinomyces thailandica]
MRSYVQVLTTPTADTPGTTLLLHFDNKRYLIGSLAEGTQRASVQMGARMLKVSECFITGRTEWRNVGGLIGMILTLADASSSSAAASAEDAKKRAQVKGKKLGISGDAKKMRELEEQARKETDSRLTLFSAPNLNHTLATARRFVFRKGMPIDVHEIEEDESKQTGKDEDEWAPYWADNNIKVWAMSVKPRPTSNAVDSKPATGSGTVSPRKRSIDEVYEREPVPDGGQTITASDFTPKERSLLTAKAVVAEMFNSSWRMDTLHETPLADVKLPASIFIRNEETNKIERYSGPLPGGQQPVPDPTMTVLVRKPWPGALIETLPPTEPAKEAVSYIFRNHTQRGKFHPERAEALKVEKGFKWAQLSFGNSVQNQDDETITPDMVLGESKEGGGMAVVDLPDSSYIDALLSRPEWREPKVISGVGAIVWLCGPNVASDERVQSFMKEKAHMQHVISGPETCPNNIALDSAAAATVRLRQVDPARYVTPVHQNQLLQGPPLLPENARSAERGQVIQLEPSLEVHNKQATPYLDISATEAETSGEVLEEAKKAQAGCQEIDASTQRWLNSLPPGASQVEITTLGTGSALPSKYRNVSATLMRVPGWGSMLFDCGENTLGQLKRVFTADELKDILHELRMIFISHMHADHHLGTVGVIKAWYVEVHSCQPLPAGSLNKDTFGGQSALAVVSEPAMCSWLSEYAAVEDFGFSRVAPLCIFPANPSRRIPSKLGWFTSPTELSSLPSSQARTDLLAERHVQASLLNLSDIQAVPVQHCHGARAVSITFPSKFKASYSGDCRPSRPFSMIGKGSTVCIHEATFDDELQGDAEAKNHSTTSEALSVAQAMGAKSCVLTHFSQRYQKLPILEHGASSTGDAAEPAKAVSEDVVMSDDVEDEPGSMREDTAGPLEDTAPTFPDQPDLNGSSHTVELPAQSKRAGLAKNSTDEPFGDERNGVDTPRRSGPEAVKFKLTSDMKVAVAFDYMRVKVGDICQLQKFTPALLKLFAEEEKPELEVAAIDEGKGGKKGKGKVKGKNKSQRGNA